MIYNLQLRGSVLSSLRFAHPSRVNRDDLAEFDPFDDETPPTKPFHSLPRVLTREEAEERFELDMRREAEYMAHVSDVIGWRAA